MLSVSFFRDVLNFAGTAEWAQLDLQSIQHRDYFGHLSIFLNLIIIDVLIFKLKQSLAKNYDLAKNAVVTSKKYFYTRLFLYLSQYDTYYKLLSM